jgi:hypothetical protein
MYQHAEWNGSSYDGVWWVGPYDWDDGYIDKTQKTWYSNNVELLSMPSGEVILFYSDSASVEARRSGDDFATPVEVFAHSADQLSAALGPDGKGHLVNSYYGGYGVSYQMKYITRSASGAWSEAEIIGGGKYGMIAFAPNCDPVVVSQGDEGIDVWQRMNGAWALTASLSYEDDGYGTPGVVVDEHGRYHVSMSRWGYSSGKNGVFYVMLCPDLSN